MYNHATARWKNVNRECQTNCKNQKPTLEYTLARQYACLSRYKISTHTFTLNETGSEAQANSVIALLIMDAAQGGKLK